MRRILATEFGIWPATKNLAALSDSLLASKLHWATLANHLLLYDQIVIPTGNFQILPVLRLILGDDLFRQLIATKAIVLARHDKWFAYIGNGGGLQYFSIGSKDAKDANLAHGYFAPLDEALDIAISSTSPSTSLENKSIITNLLLDNVISTPLEDIGGSLFEETYNDVLGSSYLREFMALRNAGRSLANLKGIKSNQVTFFNPQIPQNSNDVPEIRAVLRVAFENLILAIGTYTEATEISGGDETLAIVNAKGQRYGASIAGKDAFTSIQEISGVPDLGSAFASKQLSPNEIIQLRESKHCVYLRNWLSKQDPSLDSNEIVQKYIESIGKPGLLETVPAKILRFAAVTGISIAYPVLGVGVGLADSFLIDKWLLAKSPRLFMEDAKLLMLRKKSEAKISEPIMRGRDRNKPCYCGSGKKYKHCHGKKL